MLHIERFVCNPLQENCYIVSDETREAVVIDCGAFYPEECTAIADYLRSHQLKPVRLLATHGHFDHNFGNHYLYSQYGLQVEISLADELLLSQMDRQAYAMCMIRISDEPPHIGHFFSENEVLTFGSHQFSVLPTPGHSPGSVIFYCEAEHVAFSGDTLFQMSVGRTDLQLGNHHDLMDSLQDVVAKLPPETVVLPGHGPQTTIADELRHNPYLQ